ncbi:MULTISPECIES: hypothetical protein [unclassified Streptococcus]|uniref:hypothetical protein n=1 Tax=unclassified Streptococcus TaxID=2608887 RepID=UPI0011B35A4D|nr:MULTISPECIES: hypothetical protein [unclassified Streptococcus]TWS94800.1 hypothetical protein FRX52_02460 [Streptococcus sp. sy018]TWT16311.1 hypothetical protein FRX51_03230 [Streptococcus sp. sy010]
MALKNLNFFLSFNAPLFLARKELRFVSASRWSEKGENGSETEKGVKVALLIFLDDSDYPNDKTNLGEQLIVKVPYASLDDFKDFLPMKTVCELINIEKAVVYGEYRNQLSLTASVIKAEDSIEL